MPGRRHDIDSIGATYQDCAKLFLGRLSSVAEVPQPHDYGIDLFCQPRSALGKSSTTVHETYGVQVKGGRAVLEYGGVDRRKQYRKHEFDWLRAQTIPLYLLRVGSDLRTVDFHSIYPVWFVLAQRPYPGRIVCSPGQVSDVPFDVLANAAREAQFTSGAGHDGKTWTVDLGPPFLRLTLANLSDDAFIGRAAERLPTWIQMDRKTVALRQLGVVEGINRWKTYLADSTDPPPTSLELVHQATWNTSPATITTLARYLEPILVNLGASMRDQQDPDAWRLKALLEWLAPRGFLGDMTKNLAISLPDEPLAAPEPKHAPRLCKPSSYFARPS
jgi:hypothetical protein